MNLKDRFKQEFGKIGINRKGELMPKKKDEGISITPEQLEEYEAAMKYYEEHGTLPKDTITIGNGETVDINTGVIEGQAVEIKDEPKTEPKAEEIKTPEPPSQPPVATMAPEPEKKPDNQVTISEQPKQEKAIVLNMPEQKEATPAGIVYHSVDIEKAIPGNGFIFNIEDRFLPEMARLDGKDPQLFATGDLQQAIINPHRPRNKPAWDLYKNQYFRYTVAAPGGDLDQPGAGRAEAIQLMRIDQEDKDKKKGDLFDGLK